ncbi:hypothetical protein [Hominenteromicrobium sp.]|uniref:hypothetical protein n=1 Tax=Hominenteromicrobium sp. TaxID=3073581 RepID=UPI00399A00BF
MDELFFQFTIVLNIFQSFSAPKAKKKYPQIGKTIRLLIIPSHTLSATIFSTARKAIRFSKATKGVESADPQVVTTTDKFMVRIRPLLLSKIKGEKPEKYMVLSL